MSKIILNNIKGHIEIENCGVFYKISSKDCYAGIFTNYFSNFPDLDMCYISLSKIWDKNNKDKLGFKEIIESSISLAELMDAFNLLDYEDRVINLVIVCRLEAEE